jgi:long-chain acyl-CoA synthetase
VTEEWTPQTGELSPTLKLKRNYLSKEYRDIIGEIYFNGEKDITVLVRIKKGINGMLKNLPKF